MAKKNIIPEQERYDGRAWYVVHTFSGHEEKVKTTLQKKIAAQGLEDKIFDVIVPMHQESEYKDGRRKIVKKKLLPSYILVNMIVDNNTWYVVRNTESVTGFLGTDKNPIPLSLEEAEKLLNDMINAPADETGGFKVNDSVRIIDGIFNNRVGVIKKIDAAKQRLKVLVENMPVDLDVSQVEKI